MHLDGKVAIVTGGSRGVGYAIADLLLEKGCKVSICSKNAQNGEKAQQKLAEKHGKDNIVYIQCDVGKKEQLEAMFKKALDTYKKLDIVVNNAGVIYESNWEEEINVNLFSAIRGTYIGFEYMDKNKGGNGGVIINVGSICSFMGMPMIPCYVASKHGIKGFTESVGITSEEFYGIRVNAVCPGWVTTDMYADVRDPKKEDIVCYGRDGAALANLSQSSSENMSAEDVARGAMELIEDESINGQCKLVVGQRSAMIPTANNPKLNEVMFALLK